MAFLLLAGSLTLGVISATTAYLPKLDWPDEKLLGLTLHAEQQPITPDMLAQLRLAGTTRVRVKEFSLANWSHRGWFLLAVAGLLAGAALARVGARRQPGPVTDEMPVDQAVARIREIVAELRRQLPGLPDEPARLRLILDRLGHVQSDLVPVIAAARAQLIAQRGVRGYAEFMVGFAAVERQLNRAWSAAADGAYAEAAECLAMADSLWPSPKP